MAEDLRGPVVPSQLNYASALPVAIESRSNRRLFYPNNGTEFGPNKTRQIRMNINSNSLIDFTHSYFKFTLKNMDAAYDVALDSGVPFIKRLQIQSNGVDLEDIQEYGRLHAMLMDIQSSRMNFDEYSTTIHHQSGQGTATTHTLDNAGADKETAYTMGAANTYTGAAAIAAADALDAQEAHVHTALAKLTGTAVGAHLDMPAFNAGAVVADELTAQSKKIGNVVGVALNEIQHDVNLKNQRIVNSVTSSVNVALGNNKKDVTKTSQKIAHSGGTKTFCFPLISCIFNLEKYFPMILCNQGIDLIFHLADSNEIGVWGGGTS